MDHTISRNYSQRMELLAKAREMSARLKQEIDALPDTLTDDEWDEAIHELETQFDTMPLFVKAQALEYKESRNEWFRAFAQSFGICRDRRITRKQGEIFARYSEQNHEPDTGRGTNYFVRVGNLFIRTIVFSAHEPAYITITELI